MHWLHMFRQLGFVHYRLKGEGQEVSASPKFHMQGMWELYSFTYYLFCASV